MGSTGSPEPTGERPPREVGNAVEKALSLTSAPRPPERPRRVVPGDPRARADPSPWTCPGASHLCRLLSTPSPGTPPLAPWAAATGASTYTCSVEGGRHCSARQGPTRGLGEAQARSLAPTTAARSPRRRPWAPARGAAVAIFAWVARAAPPGATPSVALRSRPRLSSAADVEQPPTTLLRRTRRHDPRRGRPRPAPLAVAATAPVGRRGGGAPISTHDPFKREEGPPSVPSELPLSPFLDPSST